MVIKEVVREKGFTLQAVAEQLCITKGAISQMVNGSPNVKTLRRIAEIIGCQVGDFFRDEMTVTEPDQPSIKCPHCGHELTIRIE